MRRARARLASRVALAGLACALVAGCATPPRAVPLPRDDARPAALLEGPAGSGRARQVLLAERPARLRVEVLGLLDQTVAVLTTDGERYRLFRSEDRSLVTGPVHAALLWEVAGLAVTPEQAVRLLLGAPPPLEGAALAGGALLPEGGLRLDLRAPAGGAAQRLDFDADGRLVAWADVGPDGESRTEARWSDYRPLGDVAFAHEVEIADRTSGARVRVRFLAVELNAEIPADAFELSAGGAG